MNDLIIRFVEDEDFREKVFDLMDKLRSMGCVDDYAPSPSGMLIAQHEWDVTSSRRIEMRVWLFENDVTVQTMRHEHELAGLMRVWVLKDLETKFYTVESRSEAVELANRLYLKAYK